MDWENTGYDYEVSVSVVHQTNVYTILGNLTGVLYDGLTITENYYSDSRVQAKLSTVVKEGESDGYVENARLRIILMIPSRNWSRALMTGYVSDINESSEKGYTKRTYTLEGTMWGLLNHKTKSQITIGKGTKLVTIWSKLLSGQTKMQYDTTYALDHKFASTVIYEAGTSLATILFELSSGYDRMDTDEYGIVTLTRYISPKNRSADYRIDSSDVRGLSFGPYNHNRKDWEAPGRAVVTTTVSVTKKNKTVQKVLVGYYDAPSTDKTSINTRGYLIARTDSYAGSKDKPSTSELNQEAKKNWQKAQVDLGGELTFSSIFKDYHAGDIVEFVLPGNDISMTKSVKKCLVSSLSTNLADMTQSLTLKEV